MREATGDQQGQPKDDDPQQGKEVRSASGEYAYSLT